MRILIIGSGLAGINAALLASEFADVKLLSKSALEETNTQRAQGGIAAAVTALDDPAIHAADTIRAGAGLCDPIAVETLTADGAAAIQRLLNLGVEFDRDPDGQLALANEGAHSTPRVLHAGGDQTGLHIQSALSRRLSEANVDVRTDVAVTDLAIEAGRCIGATTDDRETFLADAVILATGGAGALYRTTTNPANATGDGVALAFRAGALVRDLEFVQFHPTALVSDGSAFLISEALRGDGAVLLDSAGDRFMPRVHPDAELAPRSVVAQAITEAMRRTGANHVMLDISHRDPDYLRHRFPGVYRGALERGHDLTAGPIPVAPAAHYHMGGVYTDIDGRTTVQGLFAAGESASTGAHGANRVASNSLLEAAVFSTRAVEAIRRNVESAVVPCVDVQATHWHRESAAPSWDVLRSTMNDFVGITRTADRLQTAVDRFEEWSESDDASADPSLPLATLTARLIAEAALQRTETRGAHLRLEHPLTNETWQRHSYWQLARE
ncbi:MAG: L-aspartate oxidase [Chloroflexi bacterium]|nr:L-aspartate oxidase [Chloroflexota bacterium]